MKDDDYLETETILRDEQLLLERVHRQSHEPRR